MNTKKQHFHTNRVSSLQVDELPDTEKSEPSEKKLSHKEKKKLKKQQEYEKQVEMLTKKGGQGHSDLDANFTVSQAQKSAGKKCRYFITLWYSIVIYNIHYCRIRDVIPQTHLAPVINCWAIRVVSSSCLFSSNMV